MTGRSTADDSPWNTAITIAPSSSEKKKKRCQKKRCQPPKLENLAACPDLVAGTFFLFFLPFFFFLTATHRSVSFPIRPVTSFPQEALPCRVSFALAWRLPRCVSAARPDTPSAAIASRLFPDRPAFCCAAGRLIAAGRIGRAANPESG